MPQPDGLVVGVPPADDGGDLWRIDDIQVLEDVAQVARVRALALGGGARGQVRIEAHPGADLGLLDLGGIDGVPPPAKLAREGCVVHPKECVAGVKEHGAWGRSHGRYNDSMPSRASLSAWALALGATLMPPAATADHSAGLRAEPWNPLVAAALSAALTLVAGLLLLVVVMRLTRRPRPTRDRPDPT